jgi:hypothetical protein
MDKGLSAAIVIFLKYRIDRIDASGRESSAFPHLHLVPARLAAPGIFSILFPEWLDGSEIGKYSRSSPG